MAKPNEDTRRARNRDKQRRFRARHKAELESERQQRQLLVNERPMGRPPCWRLYERTRPQGDPGDVLLLRDGETVPSGYGPSTWLPSLPVTRQLAESLAAYRCRQIREWLTR